MAGNESDRGRPGTPAKKGRWPASSWNARQPIAHQSAATPTHFPPITSGARYSAVPDTWAPATPSASPLCPPPCGAGVKARMRSRGVGHTTSAGVALPASSALMACSCARLLQLPKSHSRRCPAKACAKPSRQRCHLPENLSTGNSFKDLRGGGQPASWEKAPAE